VAKITTTGDYLVSFTFNTPDNPPILIRPIPEAKRDGSLPV
jgi:hypothetical protein